MAPDSLKISPLSLEALRRMLMLSAEDMKKVVLPPQAREELGRAMQGYSEHVLERKMRSLSQLNSL